MTYDHVFETPASSQTKNGVPTMAVRIPSGISIAAAVRATVSITSRNPPPSSAAVGISRPKSGQAKGARLLIRQRQHVHAPAQRQQNQNAECHRAEQRDQIGSAGRGKAAEQ